MPFMHSMSVVSALVFLALQTGYYYALFRLTHYLAGRIRRVQARGGHSSVRLNPEPTLGVR